jgi:hypothetical protein
MEPVTDGQIAQPTIAVVLAEFLAEQEKRLAAKTFARYRQVIGLLTNSPTATRTRRCRKAKLNFRSSLQL